MYLRKVKKDRTCSATQPSYGYMVLESTLLTDDDDVDAHLHHMFLAVAIFLSLSKIKQIREFTFWKS